MARKQLSAGALTAPVPPVLVTVGDGEESNIITVAWTGILATHPPRTYISVRPSRHSYRLLKRTKEFVINLASTALVKKVDYCGIYTGAKVDKFEKCGFTRVKSREVSAPTVGECPIALECRVAEIIPMGTHDVFIADIVSVSCDESVFDADGKLCFDRADLLAYAHGEYFALGESLGTFGFSATKTKKRGANAGGVSKKRPSETNGKIGKSGPRDLGDGRARDKDGEAEEKRPFYLDIVKRSGRKSSGVSNKSRRGSRK